MSEVRLETPTEMASNGAHAAADHGHGHDALHTENMKFAMWLFWPRK